MTSRAKRIYYLALVLILVTAVAIGWSKSNWLWLLGIQIIPFALVASTGLLRPVEKRIQSKYRREARNRLMEVNPRIIGITGSFGKTSVKHFLGHILDLSSRTLITPGSVNTPMGVTRIIRENLNPGCKNFVVEMGAYGPGSVKRLCDLTPPGTGIITAIGHAHYERFKSLDTVARTKFELAEAVLGTSAGHMIIHESVLEHPYAAAIVTKNRSRFIVCGPSKESDFRVCTTRQTSQGVEIDLSFTEHGSDHELTLKAPIYGRHQVDNLVLAFAAAHDLGIPADRIAYSLLSLPQIPHRLEVKKLANGALYIDDAYNSNPKGFSGALQLLSLLQKPNGRRILVTPGMAELGEKHHEAHFLIGREARNHTDVILLVQAARIPSFVEGVGRDFEGNLINVDTMTKAQEWLSTNCGPADVVLIENDLPDLYEHLFVV